MNFNADSLKKEMMKKAKEEMKNRFTKDIQNLARPFGEHPRIQFIDKGPESWSVKVENVSAALKAKIDDYIKKNKG